MKISGEKRDKGRYLEKKKDIEDIWRKRQILKISGEKRDKGRYL